MYIKKFLAPQSDALAGPNLPHGTVPGAPRSDKKKVFFVLHFYLTGISAKIPKSAKAPRNVNPALHSSAFMACPLKIATIKVFQRILIVFGLLLMTY